MSSEDIIQKIVDDVIEFKTLNDRMPSTANGGYEDSLYQKFNRNKKNFTNEQLQKLASAGIDVKIKSEEEIQRKTTRIVDKVDSTISALIEFKNANGRMPSDSGETLEERSLYQLYLRTKDLYTPEQIKLLADNGIIVKEKRKNSIDEILEDSTNAIITFVVINHKMPSGKSEDKAEQSLYNSFRRNKTKYTLEQKQRLLEAGAPIQLDEAESNLVVSSLSLEEQNEFYKKQIQYCQEINNEILYNYYLTKLQIINGLSNAETGGILDGDSNGFRRKN